MLYVGITRARRRLHLVGVAEAAVDANGARTWRTPRSASALGRLWKVIDETFRRRAKARNRRPTSRRLRHRFAACRRLLASRIARVGHRRRRRGLPLILPAPVFEWARTRRRGHRHGHASLARANGARCECLRCDAQCATGLERRIRIELAAEGVDAGALDAATRDVLDAIDAVRRDPRGRWLFDPTHAEAASEWALAGMDDGAIVHVTLDRSFVADGVRWIVDFKTGRHEGGAVDAFLEREVERYRGQLERYARVVRALDARPIRLALYYPLVQAAGANGRSSPRGRKRACSETRGRPYYGVRPIQFAL